MSKTIIRAALQRVVFFFVFLCSSSSYANDVFKNLSINEGLAHTDANCIVQDSTGLIWIGTYAGLQSYDGYALKLYDYYAHNQKIYESHNRINTLACSSSQLWIGSDSGLACMDILTHRYIPFQVSNHSEHLFNGRIVKLYLDESTQYLWIKTEKDFYAARIDEASNTLHLIDWNQADRKMARERIRFDFYQGKLCLFFQSDIVQLEIKNNKVQIAERYHLAQLLEPNGSISHIKFTPEYLYVRSQKGCYRLRYTGSKIDMQHPDYIEFSQVNPIIPNEISGLFTVDNRGHLWCTYSGGLFEVEKPFDSRPTIKTYLGNNKNTHLSMTHITSLLIDSYNNLWISMMNWGVNYKTLHQSPFQEIPTEQFEKLGLKKNVILALEESDNRELWMLVEGGGLFRYYLNKSQLSHIEMQQSGRYQTLTLSLDQKKIYIGLSVGLLAYEIETGRKNWIIGGPSRQLISGTISVARTRIDRFGQIWIATWGHGLYCIQDPEHSPTVVYHLNETSPRKISSNYVSDIYIDSDAILACTENGLNKIALTNEGKLAHISTYQADPNMKNSLSCDYLACMDKQEDSVYWIGTIGGGVNKITLHSDRNNDYSATCFTTQDGLTSNDAEIVFVDEEQNVWIGGKGITQIHTKTGKISIYESVDGLQGNSFKMGAGVKSKNGYLYMGGLNGCNYFRPQSFQRPPATIDLILTELQIHNRTIYAGQPHTDGRITLSKVLNHTQHIDLAYDQNNFTLSFATLGYNLSNRIMYRYRMTGYDKAWQVIPYSQNKAFYSNLNYGDYQFELEVSTDRGFSWKAPGRVITFSILPPWWRTSWAWGIYILAFSTIAFIIFYQYSKGVRLKRENHMQELQRINDEERYQSKLHFFMNVSHELKTPLTLISLAVERILDSRFSKECSSIRTNSQKILSLIAEMVDIRKTDLGINQLSLSSLNMNEFVRLLFFEMQPWAEEKTIEMSYQVEEPNIQMEVDKEKMGKLIVNLLSNAIKYTLPGGRIQVSLRKGTLPEIEMRYKTVHQEGQVSRTDELCILTVQDSGVGISPESIRYIYERFFQIKSNTQMHLGSGIGLAIVKNMVLLHKGIILVGSERMVGTEFIVAIPIRNECPERAVEIPLDAKEFVREQALEPYEPETQEAESDHHADPAKSDLPSLLIVEDNKEMQQALKTHFKSSYQVTIADDGKKGLELCESLYPDVIISDVMMPEMDGIAMCQQIRDNLSIAYIPIILLTAKDEVESQIEGYESGADLYMPKPFSMKLLEVNLKRLTKQKERTWRQSNPPTDPVATPSRDTLIDHENKLFEEKLRQSIEKNMNNPDLSVEFLTQELCLGRTKLYQRVKEICNQSLADYIRNMRLEKAAYLLLNSTMNISEIIMEVGFVNNSHFTKVFKQKYGTTPSEYIKST